MPSRANMPHSLSPSRSASQDRVSEANADSSDPFRSSNEIQQQGGIKSPPHTLPFSFSLTLQNTGSVARDHLASERTFLAYVRTSLAFASAGVALVQLLRVSASADPRSEAGTPAVARYARPLGATLIAFGMAVLALGTFRYFAIQRALPQGLFPAARVSVLVQAVSLAVLVGVVFGVLVAVHAS